MLRRLLLSGLAAAVCSTMAGEASFPNSRAIIVDTSPYIELTAFRFGNKTDLGRDRYHESAAWLNISSQPITAFQIKVVRFDPFDRRMGTNSWTVTGKNSTDWGPLLPGTSSGDGIYGAESEDVFTAIAYVNAVRFVDGTVWWADERDVNAKLRKVEPQVRKTPDSSPSTVR